MQKTRKHTEADERKFAAASLGGPRKATAAVGITTTGIHGRIQTAFGQSNELLEVLDSIRGRLSGSGEQSSASRSLMAANSSTEAMVGGVVDNLNEALGKAREIAESIGV